jgi:flagellar biosynthesis protein FliQ
MFLFTLFVPETPRFLVSRGLMDTALSILSKVDGRAHARAALEEIVGTLREKQCGIGELLRPGIRIALWVGICLSILQQVTGINVILYYAPEIFKSIGNTSTDTALIQTIVVGAVNLLFTGLAIWKVDSFGRRPLMIVGYAGMAIFTFAIAHFFFIRSQGMGVMF